MNHHPLIVFSGSSHPGLAAAICRHLEMEPGQSRIWRFPDGEKSIKLESDVRGRDCFIVQSTCHPVDENLVELLIFLDCLRRASAAALRRLFRISAMPVRTAKTKDVPITAKLAANLITTAGADRLFRWICTPINCRAF